MNLILNELKFQIRVQPEIADFGSGQGLSVFATAGIVGLFRGLQKSENDALGQKMLFPDGHQTCDSGSW
jgi:hypothetical protein